MRRPAKHYSYETTSSKLYLSCLVAEEDFQLVSSPSALFWGNPRIVYIDNFGLSEECLLIVCMVMCNAINILKPTGYVMHQQV